MRFAGRARWIVHLFDELGEDHSEEFGFSEPVQGCEDLLVFAFSPTAERPWWTYATAGMSLCPALDGLPPTELIAYATEQSHGLVDVLYQIALRDPAAIALASGDLIHLEDAPPNLGVDLQQHLGVLESAESASLLDFPNKELHPEDQRYILARPGEDATRVRLLRVVALQDGDGARFTEQLSTIAVEKAWKLY